MSSSAPTLPVVHALGASLASRFPLLAPSLAQIAASSPEIRRRDGAPVAGRVAAPEPQAPAQLKAPEREAWIAYARRQQAGAAPGLKLFFADSFADGCHVTAGELEIWSRPLGGSPARLVAEEGRFVYRDAYPATDVLHTVACGRSEEFLHLADASAPTRFDYELHSPAGALEVEAREDGGLRLADAEGRDVEIEAPWVVDASGKKSASATRWSVGPAGADGARVISLHLEAEGLVYPLVIDPSWAATGAMNNARGSHTATLLNDGQVLVVGGAAGGATITATCELYSPWNGQWSGTGSLSVPRIAHTASLLSDGTVLVAGGTDTIYATSATYSSCEIYNPVTGVWAATGAMSKRREYHAAVVLSSGQVLVSGGIDETTNPTSFHSTCEVYDPSARTWSPVGSMKIGRFGHATLLLSTGKVLLFGGGRPAIGIPNCELYDPAVKTWSATGALAAARFDFATATLPSGRILAIGGGDNSGKPLASCEVYDPTTGTWSAAASLQTARQYHAAASLSFGRVIALGGYGTVTTRLASSEVYDPVANLWTPGPALPAATWELTATLLPSGLVLAAGGASGNTVTANCELYSPSSGVWTSTGSITGGRSWPTANKLADGKVLLAGGAGADDNPTNCQIYDPAAGTWTATGSLATGRFSHTSAPLPNGDVLVAGGVAGGGFTSSCEIYSPSTGQWSPTGSLATPRRSFTATALSTGKVLVAGGWPNLALCELYDPATGQWSATGSLATGRRMHSAVSLSNGKVLVTGGATDDGNGGASYALGAELYDPATGQWSSAGDMIHSRCNHTSVVLPDGTALAIAGWGDSGLHGACDRYDPVANRWSPGPRLNSPRYIHQSVVVDTRGRVLAFGGQDGGGNCMNSAELLDPAIGQWFYTLNSMPTDFNMFASALLDSGQVLAVPGGSSGTFDTTVQSALCTFG